MRLRIGYELDFEFPQPTPVLSVLNVHFSPRLRPRGARPHPPRPAGAALELPRRLRQLVRPLHRPRRDASASRTDTVIRDSGLPDPVVPDARQHPVEELPDEALVFLLASRFCESDRMLDLAWSSSARPSPAGRGCRRSATSSTTTSASTTSQARPTRSAFEGYAEGVGVCRDYAHLAVAFCRALNIPARYCTGYLGDVGTPPPYPPGDFAAWFEAYLGGAWRLFDPRNNVPRQAACSWPTAATPPTWRSPPPSAPANSACETSASGPTRFPKMT